MEESGDDGSVGASSSLGVDGWSSLGGDVEALADPDIDPDGSEGRLEGSGGERLDVGRGIGGGIGWADRVRRGDAERE